MDAFDYHNPVKIIFGEGRVNEVGKLIDRSKKVLLLLGQSAVKSNGVLSQVEQSLKDHQVVHFEGITPNPEYEILKGAIEVVHKEKIQFLLGVGGGSVIDGTKFVSAAAKYTGGSYWDLIAKRSTLKEAIPFGTILTLPGTGTEMNCYSVISRKETLEKLPFSSPLLYPRFSILDPRVTKGLPKHQIANGIVDTFVHVMEQYLTYPTQSYLQDHFSESILSTLIQLSSDLMTKDYDPIAMSNFMWCATMALNGIIGAGVPRDWSTHAIGHELTALYGIDHGRSLALVFPALMVVRRKEKKQKIIQYGQKIWGIIESDTDRAIELAILKTKMFFESLGMKLSLKDNGIPKESLDKVSKRMENKGIRVGEHHDIDSNVAIEILKHCL